jgi:hypothetical protein
MAQRGFVVQPNCFYPDPSEPSKSIEIDVAGQYFEWVNETNQDAVTASLLVECKNNAQPFAFFMQTPQIDELIDTRIHYGGFPSFSTDSETHVRIPLHRLLDVKDWHHYFEEAEVATQFCSFARANEKKKWKAEPMKNYSESFSALALATLVDRGGSPNVRLQSIQVNVSYPIIVFQGPLYRVEKASGKPNLATTDHLALHHATMISGNAVAVQIDVVTEAAFPNLIVTILNELKTFRDRLYGMYDRLLNSAIDQKRVALQHSMVATLNERPTSGRTTYS